MSFKEITPQQAWEMVQQGAVLADIRDDARFTHSHPKGAFHLTNQSFSEIIIKQQQAVLLLKIE